MKEILPVTEDDLTPGPWVWDGLDSTQATLNGDGGKALSQVICIDLPDHFNQADLQFIAAARTVVPDLLKRLASIHRDWIEARGATITTLSDIDGHPRTQREADLYRKFDRALRILRMFDEDVLRNTAEPTEVLKREAQP